MSVKDIKRPFYISTIFFITLSVGLFSYIYPSLVEKAVAQTTDYSNLQCITPEQKAVCTAQLQQVENEITAVNSQLTSTKQQGVSLARDKAVLDLQIKQAQLKIQAHQLTIAKLGQEISNKVSTINTLTGNIAAATSSLLQVLERTYEIDSFSIATALLSNKNLSDFFIDFDNFTSIKDSLQIQLDAIRNTRKQTEEAKQQLDTKRDQELDVQAQIKAEQAKIKIAQAEKQRLLNLNTKQQNEYQGQIALKQSQAAKIRAALFQLRDTAAITFGDAVKYAKEASAKTGVAPAFILAIIQQESNLGSNVGACYLSDTNGNGVKVSTGAAVKGVMKPTRDVQPFLAITSALGRDPYKTRVSCPLSIGYGGAMGPAQFIPSTWILSQDRIAANTGRSPADPWNPPDAFMASAIYLSDLGASAGTYSSQIRAACKYYGTGGSTCTYGKQVMARVATIQANIDILGN